jgi:putative NIF3 family GTP cyclohydrolase 1 type 2
MLIADFQIPGIDRQSLTAKEGFVFGDIHQELRGVTVSFTANLQAIAAAKAAGSNLMVIHDRMFFPTEYSRGLLDHNLSDRVNLPRIQALVDAGAAVFLARECIEMTYMRRSVEDVLGLPHLEDLNAVYQVQPTTLSGLARDFMNRLNLEEVRLTGRHDQPVRSLCLVNGGDGITRSPDTLIATFRQKPDAILCGETDEYPQWASLDMGIGMIQIGHIFMDNIGLRHLAGQLQEHLAGVPVGFYEIARPWRIV